MHFREILATCLNFIRTITLWDLIDVAIIAWLIYRILKFARRRGAANVIKGIVLLIAVMWLSSLFHLSVVNYLLGKTFELGFIALIVLFQPELRELLEKFGSGALRTLFTKQTPVSNIESSIEQVVLACIDMAKAKTGALIVFERSNTLDTYIKNGTAINAEPSAELIKNIFVPNTPLHDGAMIIKEGRIAAAACMLPLSSNTHLSRELGMRHRAGVGMSERSDSVVVIVSEETGTISVATDGMLKRHLSPQTFEMLLRNELVPKNDEEGLRRVIKKPKFMSGKQ